VQVKTAIVVGAGLSGLAAAFALQNAGFVVRVLERLDRPGGRVLTLRKNGYLIDVGADAMTQAYTVYRSIIAELGLSDRVVVSSQVLGITRGTRVHDIHLARPWSVLGTGAVSWKAKFAVLTNLRKVRSLLKGIDSFELVESADRDDPEVTAWQLSDRLFGAEVTEYLIDPVVRFTSGTGARSCSLLGALAPLTSWAAQMITIEGGLDSVPRALAERVPVEFDVEVIRVTDAADGVSVEYRHRDNRVLEDQCDYCVLSTPYAVAQKLWAPLASYVPEFNLNLQHVKLISIAIGYDRLCSSRAYVVAIPSADHPDLLVGFLQHNKAHDRAPQGHSLLTFYTDTLATDRMLDWPNSKLEEWAAGFTETAFPELKGHRDMCEITRWPIAGYLATPGFWRRSRELLRALPVDGRVQIAGDLFGAGSMESAARWGYRAAERVVRAASANRS
jgi:protoporphyrinogen oxidase